MKIKQGISLIVLVITIIVMIILAGAIILTLDNSGIIRKASNAVEKSNEATVKQIAQMAWASAYASGDTELEELQAAVDKSLTDNKVDTTKYVVEVTTKGVNVALKGPWVQTGETVTDGKITINVGEKINYTATGTDYTGDWKVLGASKYGELLIMSDSYVTTHRLGYKSTTTDSAERLKESQNAWLNGAAELDKVCKPYGKGKGATEARSVKIEDIDRITEFDKTKYATNYIYEYGNVVTYTYNGTTTPAYAGTNGNTGTLSIEHSNGFYFYNGSGFAHVNDLITGIKDTIFAKVKNDYYGYSVANLELSDEASLLIFGEYDKEKDAYSQHYWIASSCVMTYPNHVRYAMRMVEKNGTVRLYSFLTSFGDLSGSTHGVRAVVSLAIDAKITADTAGSWNISI